MPSITVTRKNFYFRYVGLAALTLNTAPWANKAIKVYRPAAGTGLAMQSWLGSFGGATPGGAVTTLSPGAGYHAVMGLFDGSYTMPDCVLIEDIVDGGATVSTIELEYDEAGTRSASSLIKTGNAGNFTVTSITGVASPMYSLADSVPAALTVAQAFTFTVGQRFDVEGVVATTGRIVLTRV